MFIEAVDLCDHCYHCVTTRANTQGCVMAIRDAVRLDLSIAAPHRWVSMTYIFLCLVGRTCLRVVRCGKQPQAYP